MKISKNAINLILYYIAIIFLSISAFRLFNHRWVHHFKMNESLVKDDGFQESFRFYLSYGYYEAVASGTSIAYNLINNFIYKINHNVLQSLRWNSLLSLIGIITTWFLFLKNTLNLDKKKSFLMILLLINVGFRSFAYFHPINDALFVLFVTLSFITLYKAIKNNDTKISPFILSGIFCALAASTREMLVFYLPGFIIMLIALVYKQKQNYKFAFAWITSLILFVSIINFPSIIKTGFISIHDKGKNLKNATWAEINYLTLLQNKDKLLIGRVQKNNSIKGEKEVFEYKQKHGSTSLPKTYFQAFFWDLSITIKNFFGLLYLSQLPFLVQMGFYYILFLSTLFYLFKIKNENFDLLQITPLLFFITFTILICIIPIRQIEFRHFMFFTFFITSFGIIEIFKLKFTYPIIEKMFYLNIILISISNILLWGVY